MSDIYCNGFASCGESTVITTSRFPTMAVVCLGSASCINIAISNGTIIESLEALGYLSAANVHHARQFRGDGIDE